MAITFGQLQAIKTKGIQGGAKSPQFAQNLAKIENIFNQHESYKAQLNEAEQNGGQTGSTSTQAFGTTSMSVQELETKIAECENEFNNYYALMNEQTTPKQNNTQENEDEKNKVKPKNFSGLMA